MMYSNLRHWGPFFVAHINKPYWPSPNISFSVVPGLPAKKNIARQIASLGFECSKVKKKELRWMAEITKHILSLTTPNFHV